MSAKTTTTPSPPARHATVRSGTANPVAKALEPFVCGGSAATFASIVIHPLDLAKVRMQLYGQLNPGKPVPSFPSIISSMVQRDGVMSVYKGVDAAVGRQMVYGTARIGLHRMFSDQLVEWNDGQPISFLQKTLSGMASGAVAVCIGTPFDIALVRLQADGMAEPADRRNYKNVFDALIRTTKEEGVGALYKGLTPNILRGMSMVSRFVTRSTWIVCACTCASSSLSASKQHVLSNNVSAGVQPNVFSIYFSHNLTHHRRRRTYV
jgi:solute carrier family 25 oxoglutarate transporter 11